jgi:predicted component of type VI protein secretion system
MQAKLIVRNGKHKGQKIPLPSSLFLIGRDPRCHLRPSSELVSRLHCVIGPAPGGMLSVRDMRSSNGTYVNGRRIKWTSRLHDGDHLQIGSLGFTLEVPQGGVPVSQYRIDHRKASWLFAAEGDSGISPADTAMIKTLFEGDTKLADAEGPSEPSSNVSIKAGHLLKELLPDKASRDKNAPEDSHHGPHKP